MDLLLAFLAANTEGKIFVGSWQDSIFANTPIEITRDWENTVTVADGATLPAMPSLRPGYVYNGKVLTQVQFQGVKMALSWASNPWATPLRIPGHLEHPFR